MVETQILLAGVNDAKIFVNLVNKCVGSVTLYQSKYIVDGKSLLGVCSLDRSAPIKMEIEGDIPDEVKKDLEPFIVQ